MRVLLDTNAFLWANLDPARLGSQEEVLLDEDVDVLVSVASTWELAIKVGIGRLELPESLGSFVPTCLRRLRAATVGIETEHAIAVAHLPLLHRDPFDRLLISQARALRAPIVTADRVFQRYDVEVLPITT